MVLKYVGDCRALCIALLRIKKNTFLSSTGKNVSLKWEEQKTDIKQWIRFMISY